MANTNIKNSVYEAIDVIVGKRIEDLHLDKTIKCNIIKCVDSAARRYKVSYLGGEIIAYANDDTAYFSDMEVYVNVPQGDFSNKKWIIGRVSTTDLSTIDIAIGGNLNQYDVIGKNVVNVNENIFTPFTITSAARDNIDGNLQNIQILYDISDPINNKLSIDADAIEIYTEQANSILISADFSTNLVASQPKRKNISGDFGLIVRFGIKQGSSYENMREKWEKLEPNTQIKVDDLGDLATDWERFIDENNIIRLQNFILTENELHNDTRNLLANEYIPKLMAFQTWLMPRVDKETNTLVEQYLLLWNEMCDLEIITQEQLEDIYKDWWEQKYVGWQEQLYSCVLNTSQMLGDYYNFRNSRQSFIVNLLSEEGLNNQTFIRIQQIIFYSNNWIIDAGNAQLYADDIKLDNINISFLKQKKNLDSEYQLSITTPDGIIFENHQIYSDAITQLLVQAKLTYNNEDVTSLSNILWFRKNSSITMDSMQYSTVGGTGWERLDQAASPTFIIQQSKTLNYENIYKVVGMPTPDIILELEFKIYNKDYQHNIFILVNGVQDFSVDNSDKILTCNVDGSTLPIENYTYTWYKTVNGETTKIPTNEDWPVNQIVVSRNDFSDKIFIECRVNIIETEQEIGSANITLVIGQEIILKNNTIKIINGDQVFQYSESGVAPTSDRYVEPLVPRKLSCNFYNVSGGLIDPGTYNVWWIYPTENTLIELPQGLETTNILTASEAPVNIKEDYNYNYTNNQITCCIQFKDETNPGIYTQQTNFFFGKMGDIGTNGTDVIAKLTSIQDTIFTTADVQDLTLHPLTMIVDRTQQETGAITYQSRWNNGLPTTNNILDFKLYRRNTLIDPSEYKSVQWSVANNGGTSKIFKVTSAVENSQYKAQIALNEKFVEHIGENYYTNQIIKCQANLPINDNSYQTYYGYYPIPLIIYYGNHDWSVGIDKNTTLRQVVYNADGRNPQYDKNLGIGLKFYGLDNSNKPDMPDIKLKLKWAPHGGIASKSKPAESYPSFSLGTTNDMIVTTERMKDQAEAEIKYEQDQLKKQYYGNDIEKEGQTHYTTLGLLYTIKGADDSYEYTLNQLKTDYQNQIYGQLFPDAADEYVVDDIVYYQYYKLPQENQPGIESLYYQIYNDLTPQTEAIYVNIIENIVNYFTTINNDGSIKRALVKDIIGDTEVELEQFEIYEQNLILAQTLINRVRDNNFMIFPNLNTEYEQSPSDSYKQQVQLVLIQLRTYVGQILDLNLKNDVLLQQLKIVNSNIETISTEITLIDQALNLINDSEPDIDANQYVDRERAYWKNFLDINYTSYLTQIYNNRINDYNSQLSVYVDQLHVMNYFNSDYIITNTIEPNDTYDGQYINQYTKIDIYSISDDETLAASIFIPIHMILNVYGLASLNGWDGNSIAINEEDGYILAPQVGAGQKHFEDNTFSGMVIGTEKSFQEDEKTGLLAYTHGKRSIFLDAETGNATFGLTEYDTNNLSNPLTEGRIELRPGKVSSIANWKIDSRSLYRVVTPDEMQNFIGYKYKKSETYDNGQKTLGPPYEDAPQYAAGSIPHDSQGILLSALPAFISVKGRMLTAEDSPDAVDFSDTGTTVRPNDTFELQIDPNNGLFFELYEHSAGRPRISNSYFSVKAEDVREEGAEQPVNKYTIQQWYLRPNTNEQVSRDLSVLDTRNESLVWDLQNPIYNGVDNQGQEVFSDEYVVAHKVFLNTTGSEFVWVFYVLDTRSVEITLNNNLTNFINEETIDFINNHKIWHRYKKAGIDHRGRLVVEGLTTDGMSVSVEEMLAFDDTNLRYIGQNLRDQDQIIARFFYPANGGDTTPLYISSTLKSDSSGGSLGNEGQRPIRIYADAYDNINDNAMSTGIFVGRSGKQNPDYAKMSRLEFKIDNDEQNFITDLFTDYDSSHYSHLRLAAQKDGAAEGFLDHSGKWITQIGGTYELNSNSTITIHSNYRGNNAPSISFKTGEYTHINLYNISSTFYLTSINGYNSIATFGRQVQNEAAWGTNSYPFAMVVDGNDECGGVYLKNKGSGWYAHKTEVKQGTSNLSYKTEIIDGQEKTGFFSTAADIGGHITHCLQAARTSYSRANEAYNHLVSHRHTYDKTTEAKVTTNQISNVTITINDEGTEKTYNNCKIKFNTAPTVSLDYDTMYTSYTGN